MNATAIARLLAAIDTRRAMLGGGIATLAIAITTGGEREGAAHTSTNWKRRRTRHQRRQRRRRGGGRGNGSGATACTVCDDADDCPFTSIQAAINAASAGATIVVCEGAYEEDITISKNLTLAAQQAQGAELEGTGNSSVVTVPAGVTATIQGLIITGGAGMPDGGARSGGAIFNRGTLTVTDNALIEKNRAQNGGGIYNSSTGTLNISDSQVSNNVAASAGGAIYNDGAITIDHSAVLENEAREDGNGGGILNTGRLTIQNDSDIRENEAGLGGGVYNQGPGTTTVIGSTIGDNEAEVQGGGIFNDGGTISVQNGIVGGNNANVTGGGIFNTQGGVVSLTGASTVTNNSPNNCEGTSACGQ